MQRIWRIKDLLEWTTRYFLDRGIAESRLEAEVLLAHVVQKDRVYLYANYEEPINTDEREKYREYIKRRVKGEPLAYIIGHKEFMSLDFKVCPEVLIPRPDTEILVETVLSLAKEENIKRIIDVGTGSGAIAVSLGVYMQDVEIYATDISFRALAVARENANDKQVDIHFVEGDLLKPFLFEQSADYIDEKTDHSPNKLDKHQLYEVSNPHVSFDMIIANLPYIPLNEMEELDRQVRDFEPHLALFAGSDGLDLYRQLIPQSHALLRPGGMILIEIDPRQVSKLMDMWQGFTDVKIIKDWTGRDRVVQARREK